jgi:amphi-Trp domain-containing protein
MPDEILFEFEQSMTRADVAAYLRTVADRLEADGNLPLSAGAQSHTVAVPARVHFEVKVEREPSRSGPAEMGIEFELEWDENGGGDESGPLEIG